MVIKDEVIARLDMGQPFTFDSRRVHRAVEKHLARTAEAGATPEPPLPF